MSRDGRSLSRGVRRSLLTQLELVATIPNERVENAARKRERRLMLNLTPLFEFGAMDFA